MQNIIMSLVQMLSGGGKVGGAVSVHLLVLIIGILFVVNSVIDSAVMMGWGLGKEEHILFWSDYIDA